MVKNSEVSTSYLHLLPWPERHPAFLRTKLMHKLDGLRQNHCLHRKNKATTLTFNTCHNVIRKSLNEHEATPHVLGSELLESSQDVLQGLGNKLEPMCQSWRLARPSLIAFTQNWNAPSSTRTLRVATDQAYSQVCCMRKHDKWDSMIFHSVKKVENCGIKENKWS